MIRPFIDAHVHLNTLSSEKMDLARRMNARFLSINTDVPEFISISDQFAVTHELQDRYPGMVRFILTVSFADWQSPDWLNKTVAKIEDGLQKGAVGIKIWKNVGMDIRDHEDKFLMIDDPRLDRFFQFLEEENVLVLGHQGEPRNCWLPLEEMTVHSDKSYFSSHPEYHMYLHPEYPSYEQQMEARDNRLRRNPNLRYVGLHLFSLEYDIKQVAQRLDEFSNSYTDTAERVCHLQLQAMHDRQAVRDFIITYQDRIMYGTDVIDDGSTRNVQDRFAELWKNHWKFFSTSEEQTAPEFSGSFNGLDLPETVLKKIFHENAAKLYQFN
jgi:hypothetical protein